MFQTVYFGLSFSLLFNLLRLPDFSLSTLQSGIEKDMLYKWDEDSGTANSGLWDPEPGTPLKVKKMGLQPPKV